MLTFPLEDLVTAFFFILPAFTANSMPIIFGGGTPIDMGRLFPDGKRILGSSKTVRGFACGLFLGSSVALLEGLIFNLHLAVLGFLISLGALLGDLFGAFLKRRMSLPSGYPLPLLDQLDFIFGAVLLTYPLEMYHPSVIFIVLLVTPPFHLFTNAVAYLLKVKKTYW